MALGDILCFLLTTLHSTIGASVLLLMSSHACADNIGSGALTKRGMNRYREAIETLDWRSKQFRSNIFHVYFTELHTAGF